MITSLNKEIQRLISCLHSPPGGGVAICISVTFFGEQRVEQYVWITLIDETSAPTSSLTANEKERYTPYWGDHGSWSARAKDVLMVNHSPKSNYLSRCIAWTHLTCTKPSPSLSLIFGILILPKMIVPYDVPPLLTWTRSFWMLKSTSSWSVNPEARAHILGSCLSQWCRDLIISALITLSTTVKASIAFSFGVCGSFSSTSSRVAVKLMLGIYGECMEVVTHPWSSLTICSEMVYVSVSVWNICIKTMSIEILTIMVRSGCTNYDGTKLLPSYKLLLNLERTPRLNLAPRSRSGNIRVHLVLAVHTSDFKAQQL